MPDQEAELVRLRREVTELKRQIDKLTACPGCGKHPTGLHFCPGPEQEPLAWNSEEKKP